MNELKKKYQEIQGLSDSLREKFIDYIDNALSQHGSCFELKPNGCDSWNERVKMDDCMIFDELPYFLLIPVDDDNAHEIHITRISSHINHFGIQYISVDGWDWRDNVFISNWYPTYDNESLMKS